MDTAGFEKNFEIFLYRMYDTKETIYSDISQAIEGLCSVLRISRVSVNYFEDSAKEAEGICNEIDYYNSGAEYDEEPLNVRFFTGISSVVYYNVYRTRDTEPWDAEEREKIGLVLKMLFVFNGRTRLMHIADKFTYNDEFGYYNTRYFMKSLTELNENKRLGGMTAVQFNLKHFSTVNQQIGRIAGNLVMYNFITKLSKIIDDRGVVCRMGGDNFCLIADSSKEDELLEALTGMSVVYDQKTREKIRISATCGVLRIPEGHVAESGSEVMDKIISAAQIARQYNTPDVMYFDEEMVRRKEKAISVLSQFNDAIINEEFRVYYQPKISLEDHRLRGAEALCRWVHGGELISPADFIPILEQGMDICRLDFYMLDHVCKDIKRWLSEGRDVVRVSVNLSRKHMMDTELVERMLRIIDGNRVPHEYLEIELTETTTDVEFKDLKRVVTGLQEAGIYTSVDDFGIGYSSLNLIKEIPWKVLKIDRSFLIGAEDDGNRHSVMFRHVVSMAREMGLECIAEGVETEQQVQLLKESSCDMAQGFLFDRPLPVEEFEKRLDSPMYESYGT